MIIRIVGGILVVAACGGFGFMMASAYRKEVNMLRQLMFLLDYMGCELQYHSTPLPELCRQAAQQATGQLQKLFLGLSNALEDQISPDVHQCMCHVLSANPNIPQLVKDQFQMLGNNLGRFDMEGQLKGLESVRSECRRNLKFLTSNQEVTLRNYQTLGLCAGAAMAILFI